MRILAVAAALLLISGTAQAASISLTSASPYSQNFDTLSNSTIPSTALPLGWQIVETGTNADGAYAASNGSNIAGNTYSFGGVGSIDRALGSIRSESLVPTFGAVFTNNTGATITEFAIQYTGEEWRLGGEGRTDQLNFQYAVGSSAVGSGTFTGVAGLDFITPDTFTAGAKDGNQAGERTLLSTTITGLSIANGEGFVIQWLDADVGGQDDGLAVDDFSLTPTLASTSPTPLPSTLSLMVTGFAGLGFVAWRRRRVSP